MKTETQKLKVNADLKSLLEGQFLTDLAEGHLEAWEERYKNYGGNKRRMEEDLYINHDPSIEIEKTEEELKRELNDAEYDFVVNKFNKEVIKIWKRGNY